MATLTIHLQPQQELNWCWAAVSLALMDYYRNRNPKFPTTQLALAREFTGGRNEQLDIFTVLTKYNISDGTSTSSYWESVRASIDDGCPVVLQVKKSGLAHFCLITGYQEKGSVFKYQVEDPDPGTCEWLTQSEIKSRGAVGVQYTKPPPRPARRSSFNCPCPCVIL